MSNDNNTHNPIQKESLSNKIKHDLNSLSDTIIESEQKPLRELVENYSSTIDEYIKKNIASTEGAGEVTLIYTDEEQCFLKVDLFYLDDKNQWKKSSFSTTKTPIKWNLIPEDQSRLRKEKEIKFEYTWP